MWRWRPPKQTLGAAGSLPVTPALSSLLPGEGLWRGTTVSVSGSTALVLTLLAEAMRQGFVAEVSVLLDGFDLVVLGPAAVGEGQPQLDRRLGGRVRNRVRSPESTGTSSRPVEAAVRRLALRLLRFGCPDREERPLPAVRSRVAAGTGRKCGQRLTASSESPAGFGEVDWAT